MKQIATLLATIVSLSFLLSCEKPPERCSEEITVSAEAGKKAEERFQQMVADSLFPFDLSKMKDGDMKKLGLLLAATQVGEKKAPFQFDTDYLETLAREFRARENLDKRFFFLFHKSEDRSFEIVQIEMEWRINQLTSKPEAYKVTKTGYFDASGNLLCFWMLTPKVSL